MVVDLSEVEFMDTAGLEVLLEECSFSSSSSWQAGTKMCLVAQEEGPIRRLLELTGLKKELFELYDELGRTFERSARYPSRLPRENEASVYERG